MPESVPGRFITLEGCDGVGKSTQAALLAATLRKRGIAVIETHQPGGTERGKILRDLLVTGDAERWSPLVETLLMLADRALHLDEVIRPALARGDWVICDRFMDSTSAYQGGAGGLGFELIDRLQTPVVGKTLPDLTLWLDLPGGTGLARAKTRDSREQTPTGRFEAKGRTYQEILQESFRTLAAAAPQRIKRIDANQDIDLVAAQIAALVEQHFFG